MAKLSANIVPMMLAAACIAATLVSTELAQLTTLPPLPTIPISQIPGLLPPLKGADQCWLPLTNIPDCHSEIFRSLSSGHVSNIGPACCNGINQVTDKCWSKMLPFHPTFPSSLKQFCAVAPSFDHLFAGIKLSVTPASDHTFDQTTLSPSPSPDHAFAGSNPSLPPSPYHIFAGTKVFVPEADLAEVTECWSSITNTEGCALEIYKSLVTGQFNGLGHACCKGVAEITDKCWPKMFPFNPFFPQLLQNTCGIVLGA
ncbi:hypothetical protein WN944_002547 [Citrus x changshan-huyou]|uniref:Egg cell-secreted-like protein n=2 Tax=Citrus TaxID=2706 RepID=A0ACB8P5X9_CITSI|nr:Egg cell-secreted-like protein [Citrus sinensis]